MSTRPASRAGPVSYTHLDVYKRQLYEYADGDPAAGDEATAAARDVEDTIFVMMALYPVAVAGDQERLAAAELILLQRLRPLNTVPAMIG